MIRILLACKVYGAIKVRMVHLYFNLSQSGPQQKMFSKTLTISMCNEIG